MGSKKCLIISGPQGSGKTELMKSLQKAFGGVYYGEGREEDMTVHKAIFCDLDFSKKSIQTQLEYLEVHNTVVDTVVFTTQDRVSKDDFKTNYDLEILNLRGRNGEGNV